MLTTHTHCRERVPRRNVQCLHNRNIHKLGQNTTTKVRNAGSAVRNGVTGHNVTIRVKMFSCRSQHDQCKQKCLQYRESLAKHDVNILKYDGLKHGHWWWKYCHCSYKKVTFLHTVRTTGCNNQSKEVNVILDYFLEIQT